MSSNPSDSDSRRWGVSKARDKVLGASEQFSRSTAQKGSEASMMDKLEKGSAYAPSLREPWRGLAASPRIDYLCEPEEPS